MKKLFSVGCFGVILAAVLGATWYLANQIPSFSQQLPRNNAPLLVSMTKPKDGGAYPVSGALTVKAEAIGSSPLARLELWADGTLAQTFSAPLPGLAVLDNAWQWTPRTLGDHTLYARGVDNAGRDALSNVLHVRAVPDPGIVLVIAARENDTPEKLAQTYRTNVAAILTANPQLKGGTAIPAGQDVFVPLPPPNSPPAPAASNSPLPNSPAGPASPGSPNNVAWLLQKNLLGQLTPINLPAPPALQGGAQDCSAHLILSDSADNESGFFVYRLDPQASAFARIATLSAHSGNQPVEFDDDNLNGTYQYYVAAYNSAGERASNIIQVSSNDPQCATANPIVRLSDLVPVNTGGLELAYLYVTVDGNQWTRVPRDKTQFIDPQTPIRLADVEALVSPGATQMKTLSGEAWGWKSGSLISLGHFSKDLSGVPSSAGPSSDLLPLTTLQARGTFNVSTADYNWVKEWSHNTQQLASAMFRWSAYGDISHGKWQVSAQPFSNVPDLNPPGMLLIGDAPKPESPEEPVQFPIDLSPLVSNPETKPNQPSGNPLAKASLSPFAPMFQPSASPNSQPQVVRQPLLVLTQQEQSSQKSTVMLNPDLIDLAKMGLDTFYVRVLPMNGNQIVGKPSNTVAVHYDTTSQQVPIIQITPQPQKIGYDVKILNFTPTNFADPQYEFCVMVLKNPYYGSIMPNWGSAAPGKPTCPPKKELPSQYGIGAALEDLGGLVESGVNWVKGLYDDLDAFVKKWAAKLNPLCVGADFATEAAGHGGKTVDDVCNTVASLAVDAAKMYAGMPPTLPNFDDLTNMGKDYLVELAANELESKGIACPQECKDLLGQGLDYTMDQLKQSQGSPSCIDQTAAAENGLEPLCPPEGVEVVPDPRGQYAPALLTVQLTRPPLTGPPAPDTPLKACGLDVTNTYANKFWVGKQVPLPVPYGVPDLNWQGAPLTGQLFVQTSMPVPVIDPGRSVTLTVPLNYPRGLSWDENGYEIWGIAPWLPGHLETWKNHWEIPDMYVWMNDWFVEYHGAQVTLKASTCGPAKSDQTQTGPLMVPQLKSWYGPP